MRPRALAALSAALVLTATGACSSSNETPAPAPSEASAAEQLAEVKKAFDDAGTVSFTLTSKDVPPRYNGATAGSGDGIISETEPKFQGEITATLEGVSAQIELITIGDDAWIKFFTPAYVPFNLSTVGAPNPSTFFDTADGLSSLLAKTTDPQRTGEVRDGQEVLEKISGTLPGEAIEQLFEQGDGTGTFDVVYGITEDGELRTSVLTGPFVKGTTSTYSVRLVDYGAPVEITRP